MHIPAAIHQILRAAPLRHAPLRRWAAIWLVALGVSTAHAGAAPALACSPVLNPSHSLWAAADFDGNDSIELARVRVAWNGDGVAASGVELFAACRNPGLPVFGALLRAGLVLSARDLDADDDPDLVLREPDGGEAVRIWLNDGKGGFSAARLSDFPDAGVEPPHLDRPAKRTPRPVVSASCHYACVPTRAGGAPFLPPSPRDARESRTQGPAGWRSAGQSRGPPFLSR